MDKNDMGALCAWITLATVNERVEKRRTSPDCWGAVDVDGWTAADCAAKGDVGEGTGDG
jgi:hypothetical protein